MSEDLRTQIIRLASTLPKGSDRKALLDVLSGSSPVGGSPTGPPTGRNPANQGDWKTSADVYWVDVSGGTYEFARRSKTLTFIHEKGRQKRIDLGPVKDWVEARDVASKHHLKRHGQRS